MGDEFLGNYSFLGYLWRGLEFYKCLEVLGICFVGGELVYIKRVVVGLDLELGGFLFWVFFWNRLRLGFFLRRGVFCGYFRGL